MKKILNIGLLIGLLISINGCSSKNGAYKDFKKSPCACFSKYKGEVKDV